MRFGVGEEGREVPDDTKIATLDILPKLDVNAEAFAKCTGLIMNHRTFSLLCNGAGGVRPVVRDAMIFGMYEGKPIFLEETVSDWAIVLRMPVDLVTIGPISFGFAP